MNIKTKITTAIVTTVIGIGALTLTYSSISPSPQELIQKKLETLQLSQKKTITYQEFLIYQKELIEEAEKLKAEMVENKMDTTSVDEYIQNLKDGRTKNFTRGRRKRIQS